MEFSVQKDMIWQPVHTRPRCEKKFYSFCEHSSIEVYLPLKVHLNTVRKKIMKSMVPMFPGYAFACLNADLKNKINLSSTVVHYIGLNREQETSLIEDLKSIVILEKLQSDSENLIVAPELKPGKEVYIKSGALKGLTGVVEKRKGVHRVVVNVEIISQSVSMELDACDVELEY